MSRQPLPLTDLLECRTPLATDALSAIYYRAQPDALRGLSNALLPSEAGIPA